MRTVTRAFTPLELLVVIAIISILIAIAVAVTGRISDGPEGVRCATQLSRLTTAYMAYVNQYNSGRFPPLYDPREYDASSKSYNLTDSDNYYITNPAGNWQAGFGPLIWHRLITPEYFICPSVVDSDEPWWRSQADDNIDAWWGRYPNPHPDRLFREKKVVNKQATISERSFASYSIRHKLHPWPVSQVTSPQPGIRGAAKHGRRAILADNPNTLRMVSERHGSGVNVAFIDGSVEWREGGKFMDALERAAPCIADMDAVWCALDYDKTPEELDK